jgi:twitching motility two-component system response regulator PilH
MTATPYRYTRGEMAMAVKKILVVDDSPTDLQWFSELLSKKGFQVLTAASGEEGISKAKAEMPDLVLMDVVMPGLNGFQATREIVKGEATKHIPVILCTNKSQETDRIWGLKQGAKDYVTKPIDADELLGKIAAQG